MGRNSSIAIVRWSRRSWVSTRPATARVIRPVMTRHRPRRGRGSRWRADLTSAGRRARCCRLRLRRISAGVPSAMISPSRISSSRSQRSASSMTWLETKHRRAGVGEPVEQSPQLAAEHRVQADGRLVEDEQVGLAEQGDGEAHPGELATAEPVDHLVGVAAELDGLDGPVDRVRAQAAHPGEEAAGSRPRSGRRTRWRPACRSRPGRAAPGCRPPPRRPAPTPP